MLRLYNTATRTLEDFIPQNPPTVTMYNCGPTVYNYAHIGNLRAYVFADVLRRTLEQNGYQVNQIINITDVGHLISDADEGEDKMVIGATREGKSVEEIITKYTDAFYADLEALSIEAAQDKGLESHFPRATHHISEQIALINTLDEEGYTYTTSDGIYFDTSKFPRYPNFAKLDIKGMQAGMRVDMGEKKHVTDFALWKFSPSDGVIREQEWNSPLGIIRKGFPGWHIECSAMAMKYLGETIDIHTGGVDHIPVHHTNEIAQSECATGKPFARYWMHSAFMNVDGQKMSKSLGNTFTLANLREHGISPEAFRYWLLTASYRTQVNFTWEAVKGAQQGLSKLTKIISSSPESTDIDQDNLEKFKAILNNDLDTPNAVAFLQEYTKHNKESRNVRQTAIEMCNILGIDVLFRRPIDNFLFPEFVQSLMSDRKQARDTRNWAESDRLRDEIKRLGYEVKDTPEGQKLEHIEVAK